MTSSIDERSKRMICTAGCIIIGDEVLGGKVLLSGCTRQSGVKPGAWLTLQTVDTNSAYFAKFCFSLGINLKRIEVIADDEAEIIEAARRMSENYDFVVTRSDFCFGATEDKC